MLRLMQDTWEPILARYRASGRDTAEDMPTWEDFRAEYERELPTPTVAAPFSLTDEQLIHFIRTRSPRRAGGLDAIETSPEAALWLSWHSRQILSNPLEASQARKLPASKSPPCP